MRSAFALLLRSYPATTRELLGDEMVRVFAEAAADHRARGRWVYARFAAAEVAGLLVGCIRAWTRVWRADRSLDLRKMRPPEVSKQEYATALDEVLSAQREVAMNLARMQNAIARREYVKARFYSDEERKARAYLRMIHRKYRIDK